MKPRWRLAPAEHIVAAHINVQYMWKVSENQDQRKTHRNFELLYDLLLAIVKIGLFNNS
jgi:hypothetical protein